MWSLCILNYTGSLSTGAMAASSTKSSPFIVPVMRKSMVSVLVADNNHLGMVDYQRCSFFMLNVKEVSPVSDNNCDNNHNIKDLAQVV